MWSEKHRQEGMLTVEAVLSLVPFILVILGIISFINIFAVHNKIQYALHQMSNELSCYTYFYQALGVRNADLGLKSDIDLHTAKLNSAVDDLTGFIDQVGELENTLGDVASGDYGKAEEVADKGKDVIDKGKDVISSGRDLISDPKALLRGVIYKLIEEGEGGLKSWLLAEVSGGFMKVYLDESFLKDAPAAMTADQYLEHYGITNLDFGSSQLFSDDEYRLIDIVAEYDLEIHFFKLFLKDPTIHVVQRCTIPAWLDGDGVTYSK